MPLFAPTRLLKCCVLALLLFAQAAMALAACVSVSAKARDAFTVMPADCDMAPAQASANLCLAQCLAGDQADSDGRLLLPSAADIPVLRLPREPQAAPLAAALRGRPARPCTGPPLSLLCRLRL